MSDGVIIGGWSFVIVTYLITGATLAIYAWSLVTRLRKTSRPDEE